MATFTPLKDEDARSLLASYDVGELRALRPIPAGSVNSNFRLDVARDGQTTELFLRLFEEQGLEGAQYEGALLAHLSGAGVPTPRPIARRDGSTVSLLVGKPAALFPFVSGGSSCQASVDEARAAAVGRALAHIHEAGRTFPIRRVGRFEVDGLLARMPRIAAAESPEIAAMADAIPRALSRWMEQRVPEVPTGIIHGDMFRDNVLFRAAEGPDASTIVAILDFESASDGRWIFDLAVTVLAWCVGGEFSLPLARALVRSYQEVRPLHDSERRSFQAELCLAALRFTTTRITDYALRAGIGPRVMKDWRRFWMRYRFVSELTPDALLDG